MIGTYSERTVCFSFSLGQISVFAMHVGISGFETPFTYNWGGLTAACALIADIPRPNTAAVRLPANTEDSLNKRRLHMDSLLLIL
jgi:hypothetical protein